MKSFFRFALVAMVLVIVAMVSALAAMRLAIHGQEVAVPSLIAVRGLFFLVGMPVFAIYFWQQSKNVAVN